MRPLAGLDFGYTNEFERKTQPIKLTAGVMSAQEADRVLCVKAYIVR